MSAYWKTILFLLEVSIVASDRVGNAIRSSSSRVDVARADEELQAMPISLPSSNGLIIYIVMAWVGGLTAIAVIVALAFTIAHWRRPNSLRDIESVTEEPEVQHIRKSYTGQPMMWDAEGGKIITSWTPSISSTHKQWTYVVTPHPAARTKKDGWIRSSPAPNYLIEAERHIYASLD